MRNIRQIIFGAAAAALPLCTWADDYLLYWQVLDTATVEGVGINDYVSTYAQSHNNFDFDDGYSGRIAGARTVFFENGIGPSTMGSASYDGGHWAIEDEVTAAYIRGADGQTIVGTGTGKYSHFTFTPTDPAQLSFAIELGNWENGEGVTLATSGTMSYSDLAVTTQDGVHILQMRDGIELNNFQPWSPNAYVVPEPSSGLLALIGAGLLALRRRRRL